MLEQALPIVVVGGGPAGLAVTFELIERGYPVTVVERTDYENVRIGEHLPPSSVSQLLELGAKLNFAFENHVASAGVESYWGAETPAYMDYFYHPRQRGMNLTRPAFDRALAQACERAGATFLRSSCVTGIARHDSQWTIDVRTKEEISTIPASFLVDASGRAAKLSRTLGAIVEAYDDQIAIASFGARALNVRDSRSIVEACESGWWYCAPLFDERSVCMFLTDVDLIPTTRRSNLFSWWVEKLEATKHVSLRFRQTEDARQLHLRPARSQRLNQLCGKGWIAIGDAALAYDPLSSRGIAKALKHGRLAAAVIADCLIGNVDALETYRMKMFSEFSEYLALRQRYYSIENRWPNSAYWSRRRLKGGSHLKQS